MKVTSLPPGFDVPCQHAKVYRNRHAVLSVIYCIVAYLVYFSQLSRHKT